jgi:hypothetical protein
MQDAHRSPAEVDVLGVEGQGLSEAEPAPIEDSDQGPVPDPGRGPGRARPQQGCDLLGASAGRNGE